MTIVSNSSNIGKLLLDKKIITLAQAEAVMQFQREHNLRFGEAAIQLGYLTEQDVQQALANQYNYAVLQKGKSKLSENLVQAYQPSSEFAESVRTLRSQLMLRWLSEGKKNIAIVGLSESATTLVANLAIAFAQSNEKTLLVDANLREPRLHQLMGMQNKVGLVEVLASRADLATAVQVVEGVPSLHILSAGAVLPNAQEIIASRFTSEFMNQRQGGYDAVLYDLAPAALFDDAYLIAAKVRGVVIAVERDRAFTAQVLECIERCKAIDVEVVGTVLIE